MKKSARIFFLFIFKTIPLLLFAQQKYVVHGTVTAATTGEIVIGASITVPEPGMGATTNEYGFYSLTLPAGTYLLLVTAIGMAEKSIPVTVNKELRLDITLDEKVLSLEEVRVTSGSATRRITSPQMGMERIQVQEIRNIPVLLGERDILKTMQLLPGVKSAGEGNSGFYVRGGGADQNLILLDEAPVYHASHLLGFFSTFNSDAIKNVTLYKGTMPAQYGGRLSSVVDIKMNEGNNQGFGVSGGIGLIASRLNVEGPLQKGKSSFLLSGRRTYLDLFLKLGDSAFKNTQLYFYDGNAKMNFVLSQKDRLFISGYFGRDVLRQDRLAGINWGNKTATMRWNHIFSSRLFSNTSLIFSNYDYRINVNAEANRFGILSEIRDWNIKEELQWYPGARNRVVVGVNAIYHTITPGEISVNDRKPEPGAGLQERYALEYAWYATDTWKASERLTVNYGLRVSAFSILGPGDFYNIDNDGNVTGTLQYNRNEVVKTYVHPEPRLSGSYQLDGKNSIKAAYTRNVQYLHLVSNATSTSPTDKWLATSNNLRPGWADQVAVGYYRNFSDSRYELTLESYYKKMHQQLDYRNGAEVFTNAPIETQLLSGIGRAYGIEGLLRKASGRFHGWISYTLSKTERKIEGISNNDWYNARQDRTHDIAIVGIYQLNSKWVLSANWIYYTGDAVTYPSGKYRVDEEVFYYYSERNGYRMPAYHRLDLGATKQLKKGKRFSSELAFSLFNAYGRANAWQVEFRESETDPDRTEAVQTSLFTFVPSITYNFTF